MYTINRIKVAGISQDCEERRRKSGKKSKRKSLIRLKGIIIIVAMFKVREKIMT